MVKKNAAEANEFFFQFRFILVDDAILFSLQNLFLHVGVGALCGVALGGVHSMLMSWMGSPCLLTRIAEALFISLWPFSVGVKVAIRVEGGDQPQTEDFFPLRGILPLALVAFFLFLLSLVGALVINQLGVWLGGGSVTSLWTRFMSPPTVSSGMAVYPLMVLGGMVTVVGYSLAPVLAVQGETEIMNILSKSRSLSRDIKMSMLFLHGFFFITISACFLLVALVSNVPNFTNRTIEAIFISGEASVTAFVLTHAYRQIIALEESRVSRSSARGETGRRRIRIA